MALADNALTTVENVKAYKSPWSFGSTFDSLLELLINSISEMYEQEMGDRTILDSGEDITELYDGDFDHTGRCKIFVRQWPIISIAKIEYKSGSLGVPTWTEFQDNDYTYDEEAGIIYFTASLSSILPNRKNIRITYRGGYSSVPKDLELACIKSVAKEFDKRNSQGATQESEGGGSVTWNEELDPSAKKIVVKYRRF